MSGVVYLILGSHDSNQSGGCSRFTSWLPRHNRYLRPAIGWSQRQGLLPYRARKHCACRFFIATANFGRTSSSLTYPLFYIQDILRRELDCTQSLQGDRFRAREITFCRHRTSNVSSRWSSNRMLGANELAGQDYD